jgi:hypothetical protein
MILAFLAFGRPAHAQAVFVDEEGHSGKQVLSLPYAFYNETFGFAAAYVYGLAGYPQPQSSLIATAMAGTKGSGMLALIGRDIQLPRTERLFLDPFVSVGFFGDTDAYIDGDPGFPGERAGSNNSDKDNFVSGDGLDAFFRLRFKYLLPIGVGRDEIISRIHLDQGIPRDPSRIASWWNPFASGKTYLELVPFYRQQEIDGDFVNEDIKTNGADLTLYWDNRDFFVNPSAGHSLLLKASRDFGELGSDDSWTVLQGEWDVYIPLGETKTFRQRTLALDFWTAYSPTWEVNASGDINHRAPAYTGATLGGLWKMRAYPAQRFSDKAAIYYAAELRLTPEWNPFENWPAIQKYVGVEWLQFVPFVEFGRVAPDYDLSNLHSSMKWDVGLGVRAWAKGLVVRLDTAVSEEGAGIQMMVSQPFQF